MVDPSTRPPTLKVVSERSPLSALIYRPAVTIAAAVSVADAAARMESAGVSALLVDNGPAIVTERDIARACVRGDPRERPIGELATHAPVVVPGSMAVLTGAVRSSSSTYATSWSTWAIAGPCSPSAT
jgi:CBS domain-containing protein